MGNNQKKNNITKRKINYFKFETSGYFNIKIIIIIYFYRLKSFFAKRMNSMSFECDSDIIKSYFILLNK